MDTNCFDYGLSCNRSSPIRGDPVTEIIARKIIELAQQGERDPVQLRERAIDFLSR